LGSPEFTGRFAFTPATGEQNLMRIFDEPVG
jgi:hypothetical protein